LKSLQIALVFLILIQTSPARAYKIENMEINEKQFPNIGRLFKIGVYQDKLIETAVIVDSNEWKCRPIKEKLKEVSVLDVAIKAVLVDNNCGDEKKWLRGADERVGRYFKNGGK
jgi:hypothetical protein